MLISLAQDWKKASLTLGKADSALFSCPAPWEAHLA
jgi:hypothetical protein